MQILIYIACGIGAYLLGSFSFALILSDRIMKKDIRKYGSGNAGTSNMLRTFGWQIGLANFILDVGKGMLLTFIGFWIAGSIGAMITSVCAIVGNNWPAYYGFKGGKGIAATFGVLLVWQSIPTLIIFGVCAILIAVLRYISVASILGLIASVVVSFFMYSGMIYHQIAVAVIAVMAIFAHRSNIMRLIQGTENKISIKSAK